MSHAPKAEKKTSKVAKKPATKKAAAKKAAPRAATPKAASDKGKSQRQEERDATAATQIIPNIAEIVAKIDSDCHPS